MAINKKEILEENNIIEKNDVIDTNDTGTTSEEIPSSLYDFTDNKIHSFVKLSDKYKDILSSATTMLFVGVIGIVFMLLVIFDIITLPLNSETSWLFDSVMGGIFIILVISGIVSLMHAKQVKIDAEKEDELIAHILDWADENINKETIDVDLDMQQPNELLYFNRADKIKDILMHEFEEADEALLIELTEQIYQKLYE